jgi:DNA replication and repair protein RecF
MISYFRSHMRTGLKFDGRPVVVHGANGAGKTNILEAVSLLSPGRGLRRAAPEDIARRPEALGWKLKADVTSLMDTHELETGWQGEGGRSVLIDGKTAPQAALGRILRILWLVPAMDRLWIEAAEGRRRFLDRMTLSFEPGHSDVVLRYEKAMRERNRLLKDEVRDTGWYGALEEQMAAAGTLIRANRNRAVRRVAEAQDQAKTAFPVASLAIEGAEGGSEEADLEGLLTALAEGRGRDMAAGRTLTGPHRADLVALYADKGMPAAQASTGEQKALLISLILANARALAEETGAPPILLMDEVAAHLDEGRRAALYDEICALGGQAFLTGTGPELFEGMSGRAQVIQVVDKNGLSEVKEEN